VIIAAGDVILRPWRDDDAETLARLADDPRVASMLRDRFPHPYSRADAESFIAFASSQATVTNFAIEATGEIAGGIGLEPFADVHRLTAEIGYWLGPRYWGRGLATASVVALTRHAFDALALTRVQAGVYEWNPASARVLEKAGFTLEGRMRKHVTKNGRTGDVLLYARVRPDAD